MCTPLLPTRFDAMTNCIIYHHLSRTFSPGIYIKLSRTVNGVNARVSTGNNLNVFRLSYLNVVSGNVHIFIKNILTQILAWQSLVPPTVEYACTVWEPYTAKNIDTLERTQMHPYFSNYIQCTVATILPNRQHLFD